MLIDLVSILNGLPPLVREIVLRLVAVIIAILAVLVLRVVLYWVFIAPLRRIVKRTPSDRDDLALEAIIPLMRLSVTMLVISALVDVLGFSPPVEQFIVHGIRTFIIISIIRALNRLVEVFALSSPRLFHLTGIQVEERILPFLRTGVQLTFIAIGVLAVIQEWGYDITGLLAGFGLSGLGLTLAAQDTVANLFGFLSIVGDRPFDVGHYIVTPDVEGIVERVGLRSTRVRRLNQALITVPNSKLANSPILNWTTLEKRQLDTLIRVEYDTNTAQIRDLLTRIRHFLRQHPTVQSDSVIVYLTEFNDSTMSILVRCYVLLADWVAFTAEKEVLNLAIMDIVHNAGVSVALPAQTVYISQERPPASVNNPPEPTKSAPIRTPAPTQAPSNENLAS